MLSHLSSVHIIVCDSLSLAFFFQAEDGIRDLVRSRGLGDVYKRQPATRTPGSGRPADPRSRNAGDPTSAGT